MAIRYLARAERTARRLINTLRERAGPAQRREVVRELERRVSQRPGLATRWAEARPATPDGT